MTKLNVNAKWLVLVVVGAALLLIVTSQTQVAKPDLPVEITFRKSRVGEGFVAGFYNNSGKYFKVRATLENRTVNKKVEMTLQLNPFGTREVGWLQGWTFVSGEHIALYHEDYKTRVVTVP